MSYSIRHFHLLTIFVQIPHFWPVFLYCRRTFWQHGEAFVNKKSCLRSLTWNFPRWSRINSNSLLVVPFFFFFWLYLIIPQEPEQKEEHTLEGCSSYVAIDVCLVLAAVQNLESGKMSMSFQKIGCFIWWQKAVKCRTSKQSKKWGSKRQKQSKQSCIGWMCKDRNMFLFHLGSDLFVTLFFSSSHFNSG